MITVPVVDIARYADMSVDEVESLRIAD